MTTLDPEGLEKAGRTMFEREYSFDWHAENLTDSMSVESMFVREADAAVTAYLGHVHPVVDSVPELGALPDGTIVRDADGEACQKDSDEEVQWWRMLGIEDGWRSEDIHLPARVIWWGDQ